MAQPQISGYPVGPRVPRLVDRVTMTPLKAAVGFTFAGTPPVVASGTRRTMFQDRIGESASSGILQTRANCTHGGGVVPAGSNWILNTLSMSVRRVGLTALTAAEMWEIINNIAVRLNYGNQSQELGNPGDWGGGAGVGGGITNGEPSMAKVRRIGPVTVESLKAFTLEFETTKQIEIATAGDIEIIATFGRITDYEIGHRLGA